MLPHARRPASSPYALTPVSAAFQDVPPEHSMGAHTLNVQDHRGMGRSMHAHRPTSCTSLLVGLPHCRSSALGEFALRLCEPRLSLLTQQSQMCRCPAALSSCHPSAHNRVGPGTFCPSCRYPTVVPRNLALLASAKTSDEGSASAAICCWARARELTNLLLLTSSLDTLFRRLTLRVRYDPNPVSHKLAGPDRG